MVAPIWMKKLSVKEINFDVDKLGTDDYVKLTGEPTVCFMGEIHCYNDNYNRHESGERCPECAKFCWQVPSIFDSSHGDRMKNELLNEIADHMKHTHPDIIGNKWLGKD